MFDSERKYSKLRAKGKQIEALVSEVIKCLAAKSHFSFSYSRKESLLKSKLLS